MSKARAPAAQDGRKAEVLSTFLGSENNTLTGCINSLKKETVSGIQKISVSFSLIFLLFFISLFIVFLTQGGLILFYSTSSQEISLQTVS